MSSLPWRFPRTICSKSYQTILATVFAFSDSAGKLRRSFTPFICRLNLVLRGAYTARALAGMIEKVGLLPAGNRQQIPFAYKMYMKDTEFGMVPFQGLVKRE